MSHTVSQEEQPVSIKSLLGPLIAVIVGMIMVVLDGTVVNVALQGLVKEFDTTITHMQWAITGYTLALSAVIPLSGWMTDRFGAKKIFLLSVIFFTLGSTLCALAQTADQLIIFRVIQGLGGGMVAPIGMAMVYRIAPAGKAGTVMGMLAIPLLLAPIGGPMLAGWLIEYSSWEWIFLINLPIGVLAVLVGMRYLPKIERKTTPSLDIFGMLLAPVAFASLAYGVNEGVKNWNSAAAITWLIVGGIALVLFIIVELRHKQPLLELRVFGSSDFTRGILIAWVSQIALIGTLILIPLYLQTVKGYGALDTGLYLMPQALASIVTMSISGKLYDKIGARPLAFVGLALITSAAIMLSRISPDTDVKYIMVALGLIGAGTGVAMMPINTHILAAAPLHLVGRVTSMTTALQQVISSFAVAGLTGFLSSRITDHMTGNADPIKAAVAGYGDTFLVSACIAAGGVLLTFVLRRLKPRPEDASSEMAGHAGPML